ncbi:MAG: sigma-70 family RNA polymerase sigma factor [Bacteroidetes bacterium]|nr:sigma-70 family RNA polymerase sigma factor [Bacteroidota bacterium]
MSQSLRNNKLDSMRLHNLTDEELMAEFVSGVELAFTILMGRYKSQIINYLYRYIGNYDDCYDLAQEVFVRVHRYKTNYNSTIKFTTWIYTMAANLAKTELNRYWRKNAVSIERHGNDENQTWEFADNSSFQPDSRIDQTTIAQRIQKALMLISPTHRELIILRDIQDFSYEEIAEITESELGTVKSRLNRARKMIRVHLQDIYNDYFSVSSED